MSKINTYPTFLYGKESWNNNWKHSWNTITQLSASGRVRSLTHQLYPSVETYLYYPHLTDEEADKLQGFFNTCRGSSKFFWYKDYQRSLMKNQVLARAADGTYRLVMNIGEFLEPVFKADIIEVRIDGVKTIAFIEKDGVLTIADTTPEKVVTADYNCYLKCYLKDDNTIIRRNFKNSNNASVTLCVAR